MNLDKPNMLIRFLSLVAPSYAMRIVQARYMERIYAGAQTFPSSDWSTDIGNTSANSEIAQGQKALISRSRDLSRNSPYAKRAADVIVSNVVGYGIVPKITGRTKKQTKDLNDLWKKIAETPLCDNERRHDFYSLQALALRSIVESGEVLAIKYIDKESASIQILEPDFLDDSDTDFTNGIKVNSRNQRTSYKVFKSHPGDSDGNKESVSMNADKVMHSFYQSRPGQLRGVPWCHSVLNTLKDFDDYQYATIIRQKISACLVGAITTNGSDSLLTADKLKTKRQNETKMTPGSFRYLNPGEDVTFNTPPPSQGYSEFVREVIRAVACGFGITYESISNDYSNVNFSSGRMGHLEMKRNFETWRWNMLIPQFCVPYMSLFLEFARISGAIKDITDVKVEWVPPAYNMIDPTKEIDAEKEAVKAGFKSKSMVIREQGLDPDTVREEIAAERELDKEAGLNFDVYESAMIKSSDVPTKPDNKTNPQDKSTSNDNSNPDNTPPPPPADANNVDNSNKDMNNTDSTKVNTTASTSTDSNSADVRKETLNGAQLQAITDLIQSVAAGLLPRDSAIVILKIAFNLDDATAESLIGSAGNGFEIKVTDAPPPADTAPARSDKPVKKRFFTDKDGNHWRLDKNGLTQLKTSKGK